MWYILQFVIGGTILVCASVLSKSKYLFLSGIITLLPIMTLINISLQIQNMSAANFRLTQRNAIFGAFGAVVLVSSIYILTKWLKPSQAVLSAVVIYMVYMTACKVFFSK